MSRISRLAVLITALASLFAVLSSTAGAVTFTNTGGTNFHATGGSSTLTITNTPASNFACSDATVTGSVAMGAITSFAGTLTHTGCAVAGLETEIACNYVATPFTATGAPTTTVHAAMDVDCIWRLATTPFTPLCTITGVMIASYTNPVSPSTPGRFTRPNQGGLSISNASDTSCGLFGVPTGGTRPVDLSETTFTLTDFVNSPNIVSP